MRAVIPDFTQEYIAGRGASEVRGRAPLLVSSADTIKNDVACALSAHWQLSGVVVDESMEILPKGIRGVSVGPEVQKLLHTLLPASSNRRHKRRPGLTDTAICS